jgi:hypothetical protein
VNFHHSSQPVDKIESRQAFYVTIPTQEATLLSQISHQLPVFLISIETCMHV